MSPASSPAPTPVRNDPGATPTGHQDPPAPRTSTSGNTPGPGLLVRTPVRVEVAPPRMRVRRVAAVVPCFNRRKDAEDLLGDLTQIDLSFHGPAGEPGRIDLRVLLVDNCSTDPLHTLAARPPVSLEHLRLPDNLGGAGGYNAGMKRVLGLAPDMPGALVVGGERGDPASRWHEWDPEYVWLVDSDARVGPATLRTLLEVLEARTDAVASGSAICDPQTGQAFELGGHVNRANGNFEPYVIGNAGVRTLVECDYLAACCALVRSEAIRDTGVFPERFLNGDDVEWFIRMKGATGRKILGVPWSLAMHPRFDRFPTWQRYYMTRNCFGPLHALGRAEGVGRRLLFKRALRDVPRAVQQEMMGRNDLARLQRVALRHAGSGLVEGPAPKGLINVEPSQPFSQLATGIKGAIRAKLRGTRPRTVRVHQRLLLEPAQMLQIEEQIRTAGLIRRDLKSRRVEPGVLSTLPGALARLVFGPPVDVAIVPARGRPEAWFSGRLMVEVTTGGFVIKKNRPIKTVWRALRTGLAGVWNAGRVALCPGQAPTKRARRPIATPETLTLGAVVLSYNRWTALKKTVESLREAGVGLIVVVDNASTDGSPDLIEHSFPEVRLVRLSENLGVEAFNRGVAACDADSVLLLDDDARPAPGVLEQARSLLARRPDLAAVTLHPRHPADELSEWPSAERLEGATSDEWPVMGCANLVRRRDWDAVGGYEAGYFLYRNDTDLALKLLARGRGVHFNPAWVVYHDSPTGAGGRKSVHWHERATRNWIWTARRHGRGWSGFAGGVLGWLWAHKLAGSSTKRHAATLRGAWSGWFGKPPTIRPAPDGSAFRSLVRMLVRR